MKKSVKIFEHSKIIEQVFLIYDILYYKRKKKGEKTRLDIVQEYEINSETMALLPKYDEYANLHTFVLEETDSFIVPLSPKKLVDYSCRYYGSSYEGRLEGIKQAMGITKKAPIAISVELAIFFFPHESPSNHSCIWLSHTHVDSLERKDKRSTIVLFSNGETLTVPASKMQLETKLHRTAQYRHLLQKRTVKRRTSIYYLRKENIEFVHDIQKNTYLARKK